MRRRSKLYWLNWLVLQWFTLRLHRKMALGPMRQVGWGLTVGIQPMTGWDGKPSQPLHRDLASAVLSTLGVLMCWTSVVCCDVSPVPALVAMVVFEAMTVFFVRRWKS